MEDFTLPERKYYNNSEYFLDFDRKVFVLSDAFKQRLWKNRYSFFGYKKITGTNLGDILLVDSFKSQFNAFSRICGLSLPVLDTKYVDAGVIIEPKIAEFVEKSLKSELKRFDGKQYQFDYFKENKLFGGLPDVYCEEKKLIIEIKTTGVKNFEYWKKNNPPLGYIKQAQLYTYLIGAKKFSIVAIFLEEDDYIDPDKVDITKRKIKNFNFSLDKKQVEDDMEKAREWYDKYTSLGISPTWNENNDQDLIEYLKCSNKEEWLALYKKWIAEGKVSIKNDK
ncbi:hypothetical protein PR248_02855 [Metamycoplasma hyosynoviae]|nr:hypothetical protein [Metamycoplasma hyosynoviae]MDC8913965.1 hypothetical protein [Metamycoplasma hyosynoviae]